MSEVKAVLEIVASDPVVCLTPGRQKEMADRKKMFKLTQYKMQTKNQAIIFHLSGWQDLKDWLIPGVGKGKRKSLSYTVRRNKNLFNFLQGNLGISIKL